ncbi:MAG: glycosyltransferase family 2 protein [Paludibacter sp.]|nr:glycosyltransferase family 2 protein [Paludibacter sp.]
MKITASIVTYKNKIEILKQTIDSFLNTSLDVKLYIVDNSNQESIKELCSQLSSEIEYIPMNKNVGFGAAHNIILNDISKLGIYHLVLNPDIRFEPGVLEALFNYMEDNKNVGNILPKVLYPDGSIQYLCKLLPSPLNWVGRLIIPFKSIKDKMNYNFEMRFSGYDKIMEVPYLSGCFMFLRKEAIEKVGIFDEGIFMYGEETDLNRRIGKFYKTVFYPEVEIVHDFAKGSHKELRLLIIHIKAAIYYFNKWGWFFDKERRTVNSRILANHKL